MSSSTVNFFFEDVAAPSYFPEQLDAFTTELLINYKCSEYHLNFIFCSDSYLLAINREYLNHDYLTDIITFDMSEERNILEGDIFISLDRVTDNASSHQVSRTLELIRVVSHGILHLIGFNDKTDAEIKLMRKNEEACLSLWQQFRK